MNLSMQTRAERFVAALRHGRKLQLTVEAASQQQLTMRLPYQQQIIGNPDDGVVHGGSLTTLMDTACGTLVFAAMPDYELCPTLDLRVDYMKAAAAGQDLIAQASIIRTTSTVVFAQCEVVQEQDGDIIARCTANFMRIGKEMTPPSFVALINGEPSPLGGIVGGDE